MNYNPIYICFCKATGRKPDEQKSIVGFVSWVASQKKEFAQEQNITRKHPGSKESWLTPKQMDAFHAWLKKKWLGDGAK